MFLIYYSHKKVDSRKDKEEERTEETGNDADRRDIK